MCAVCFSGPDCRQGAVPGWGARLPGLLLQCREEERVAVGLVWLVKTEDWKTTARSMRGDRERKRVMGFNLIPEGTSL